MNAATIGNLVATLGLLFAILSFRSQAKRAQLTAQADMVVRLRHEFDADSMRRRRRRAATGIQSKQHPNQDFSDLLDFLGNIAGLVERGAIDPRTAYIYFGYWIYGYWYADPEFITEEREHYSTSWKTLERVVEGKLRKARDRARGDGHPPPTEEFLRREVAQAAEMPD